jgi:cold-inducible RNA-binding protein
MKNVFVGNLSFQTSEGELRQHFESFGEIVNVRIMTDRETGRSRGFGFVEMTSDDDAMNAINALNGKELGGRALNISEARPRPERPAQRSVGGYSRNDFQKDYYRRSAR